MTDTDSALHRAIAVYHDLGWDRLPLNELPTADIGTPEQRKTALAGLRKGEWGAFGEHRRGTWGWEWRIGSADAGRLSVFAIRVGVDARRALAVLSWETNPDIAMRVIADRGAAYTEKFVAAACVSSRRGSTHGPTAYGTIALRAADAADIPVPDNLEYLKDWAVFADAVLNNDRSEIWDHVRVPPAEVLTRRFAEHAAASARAGVALTGPFRAVLRTGVARGLLDRDTALDLAFEGLDTAQRPGDKTGWLEFLRTDLDVPDSEFADRAEQFVAVLAAGVSPVTAVIAPILIATVDDDLLPDVVATALSATPAKTRKLVLDALAARQRPSEAVTDDVLAAVDAVADVRQLAAPLKRLTQAWAVTVESPVPTEADLVDWNPVPDAWMVPRFDPGPVTLDALVDIARELYARRGDTTLDVTVERFLAVATELARTDADGVRGVLDGLTGFFWTTATCDCGRPYCSNNSARSLRTARQQALLTRLGELPRLLSTPSFVDLRVDPADLLVGLRAYRDAGTDVDEGDLLLAITRTDTALIDDALLDQIESVKVDVVRHRRRPTSAGKLAAAALRAPLVEPRPDPETRRGLTTPGSLTTTRWLRKFDVEINREWYGDENLQVFPTWSDEIVTHVYSLVEIAQLARRGVPFSPSLVRKLLTVYEPGTRESPEYHAALVTAFERGLLRPVPVVVFSGDYHPARPAIARLLDDLAHAGALAVVWPLIDETIGFDAVEPRVPSGTGDLVALAARLLPSVQRAVDAGTAPKDALDLPGVRALAARSGSSIAVKDARALTAQLGETAVPTPTPPSVKTVAALTNRPFDEIWDPAVAAAPAIDDGAILTAQWHDPDAKTRAMIVTVDYPDMPGRRFALGGGWVYALEHEGQDRAVEYRPEFARPGDDPASTTVWLHWDATSRRVFVEQTRDWRNGVDGPLTDRRRLPVPSSLLAAPIAALCDENGVGRYQLASLIGSGVACADAVAIVVRQLIRSADVSPARMVGILEAEPTTLPALWPLLVESISYAATLDAVPRWLNRVLDVALQCVPYLVEAVDRGLAPESAATFPGLDEIASRTGSSAALTKARQLRELRRTGR